MADTVGAQITPVQVWRTVASPTGTPQAKRLLEKATQTFKQGTPVVVDSTGYLIASPTLSSALKLAGFSQEPAANLTTAGVPKTLTFGSVQNQTGAVLIPGGAPMNDGRCGVNICDENTLFIANCGVSHTPAVTDVGLIYGMTKDATSGLWFVDATITAAGSGAILEIVEIPVIPGDAYAASTPVAGGKIVFRITKAGQQFGI